MSSKETNNGLILEDLEIELNKFPENVFITIKVIRCGDRAIVTECPSLKVLDNGEIVSGHNYFSGILN